MYAVTVPADMLFATFEVLLTHDSLELPALCATLFGSITFTPCKMG
jgi:hypothetical protein